MSKRKHRKRKPSRRERRAGVDRPVKRQPGSAGLDAATAETDAAAAATDDANAEATPESPAPQPTVTATFQPDDAKSGAAGAASEAVAELEQRYIHRDLLRLLIQLAAFALVIVGLAVLDARTDVVGSLGSSLFKLWE